VIRTLFNNTLLVTTIGLVACDLDVGNANAGCDYLGPDAGPSCELQGESLTPGKQTVVIEPAAGAGPIEALCGCPEVGERVLSVPNHAVRLAARTHPCRDLEADCDSEVAVVTVDNSIRAENHANAVWAVCDTDGNGSPDTNREFFEQCFQFDLDSCQITATVGTCAIRLGKSAIGARGIVCGEFRRRIDNCLLDNIWRSSAADPAPPDLGPNCDPDEADPKPWETTVGESFDGTCVVEQGWIDHRLQTDAWSGVQRCIERAYREMYTWAESNLDGDNVCDRQDNCADVHNDDQRDLDCDEEGNACDDDDDGDGVLSAEEAERGGLRFCADTDDDGILDGRERNDPGDALTMNDEDSDLDGVPDRVEAGIATPEEEGPIRCGYETSPPGLERDCPGGFEARGFNGGNGGFGSDSIPVDTDKDSFPDYLDDDSDGDGVLDGDDNCRVDFNDTQRDLDEDLLGDVCDDDRDGDGIPNDQDNCPQDHNPNQDDIDDDGRGDLCEATITIISPHGDPESGPNASNEFVYSADEPHGILQVRAEVLISAGIEDLDGLEVAWSFTDVGGVAPTLTDDEPVSAGEYGSRHSTTAQWTGLPPRYSDFGRKTVRAQLLFRGEIVAESDDAAYEIFWPNFINFALPEPALSKDANFARNFPGSHAEVVAHLPMRLQSVRSGNLVQSHAARRIPNWLWYLGALDAHGEAPYASNLSLTYVVTQVEDDHVNAPFGALFPAMTSAGGDTPVNIDDVWTFASKNNEVLITRAAFNPCPPPPPAGAPYETCGRSRAEHMHAILRHEFEHVDEHIRWGAERSGSPRPLFGDVWTTAQWQFTTTTSAGWYSNFLDLNLSGAFDDFLGCDLDDDGIVSKYVPESQVSRDCQGLPQAEFQANVVPTDDLVWEVNVEALDWDVDGVPNWVENLHPPHLTYEDITNLPAQAFVSRVRAARALKSVDWGSPGENYANQ
jgi:hypothetical protein